MEPKDHTLRSVGKIISSQQKQIGTLPVRTLTISRWGKEIDPFLQLDHKGPVHIHPGEEQEKDELPNKGFEILTYLLEGYMEHTDSQRNFGVLYSGDVQLLTAGRGILHEESGQVSLSYNGKDIHAIDIWINLPRSKKHLSPAYQHVSTFQLPTISLDNVIMKVLAG
jgi:redox-sensitive bicupin YhaK (pirin superfamily)